MKCEICSKKKATVHLTELVDDQVSELHICEDCAREKSVQMEQQFGLADLLAGLSDFGKPVTGGQGASQTKPQILACENCETTYEEFKKHGRLGCSECYQAFRSQLGSLLKKIHGASKHTGKLPKHVAAESPKKKAAPKKSPKSDGIEALKEELQQAILCEDYEKAAELRDKIREMEKGKD